MDQKNEDSMQNDLRLKLKKSLIYHLITGVVIMFFVFVINAKMADIELAPKRFVAPILVGLVAGFLIFKNKEKVIISNVNLEKEVEKRTMDLKVANELLEEMKNAK